LAIEAQCRHLGNKYLPKKGVTKDIQPGVYQLASNMDKVIKTDGAKNFATASERDFDNLSTMSARAYASNRFETRDRQGVDIFKFSNFKDEAPK
jgi:hypothetical protein